MVAQESQTGKRLSLIQIWMAWGLIGAYFLFDRYYFFGKHATQAYRATPEEVWEQRGKDNKRRWGYKSVYRPTLERSRKKQILEAMGSKFFKRFRGLRLWNRIQQQNDADHEQDRGRDYRRGKSILIHLQNIDMS